MKNQTETQRRKTDQLRINLEEDILSSLRTGLEKYHFRHCALPEINLDDIDTTVEFLGKRVAVPFLISSMVGGTEESYRINHLLASAANRYNLAMGLGSQRAGIEKESVMHTFKVRDIAPDILLFANLGAVQLNYGYTIQHCQRAVDAIGADALLLHLNPLQEALTENGDTHFAGLLSKIESICQLLKVPVIVKEVGWGISAEVAKKLVDAGVQAIDVAGAGGTSWSEVEKYRMKLPEHKEVAAAFKDWGIPTAECIQEIHDKFPELTIIASGGLKNGVDVAKCIALGACLGGIARQFLIAAAESEEALDRRISVYIQQFTIAMFACGAKNIHDLQDNKLVKFQE